MAFQARRQLAAPLRTLDGVSVQPRLVLEKPPQRRSDLPMLVPVRPGRHRARESEHLASQFDKFRDAVQSLKGSRCSVGAGHHAHPDQAGALPSSQSPKTTEDMAVIDGPCVNSLPAP